MVSGAYAQIDTLRTDSTRIRDAEVEQYLKKLLDAAQDENQKKEANYDFLEIDELIVDATITKPGSDFFYYFSSGFEWPDVQGDYIVEISERPFRLTQTQVTIKINDLEVFQNMLQPRATYLEDLALYARQVTQNYLINYQQIMKELDGDDRSGSGIF